MALTSLIDQSTAAFYELNLTDKGKRWEREGRKCFWCKCPTVLTKHTIPNQATDDHVVPRGLGGSNDPSNIVSACLKCNARRCSEQQKGLREGSLLRNFNRPFDSVSQKELDIERFENEIKIAQKQFINVKEERDHAIRLNAHFLDKPLRSALGLICWAVFKKVGFQSYLKALNHNISKEKQA